MIINAGTYDISFENVYIRKIVLVLAIGTKIFRVC